MKRDEIFEKYQYHKKMMIHYRNLRYREEFEKKNDTQIKHLITEMKNYFSGYDITSVLGSRERRFVKLRAMYAHKLRDRGYTYELIGDIMLLDHATVIYYIKNKDKNGETLSNKK